MENHAHTLSPCNQPGEIETNVVREGPWEGMLINFDFKAICKVESSDLTIFLPEDIFVQEKFPLKHTFDIAAFEKLPRFTLRPIRDADEPLNEYLKLFVDICVKYHRVVVIHSQEYEMAVMPSVKFKISREEPAVTVYYQPWPKGLPRKHTPPPPPRSFACQTGPGFTSHPPDPVSQVNPTEHPELRRNHRREHRHQGHRHHSREKARNEGPPVANANAIAPAESFSFKAYLPASSATDSDVQSVGSPYSPSKNTENLLTGQRDADGGTNQSRLPPRVPVSTAGRFPGSSTGRSKGQNAGYHSGQSKCENGDQRRVVGGSAQGPMGAENDSVNEGRVGEKTKAVTIRTKVHPMYLETVAHTHSAWVFGGLAELIDNSHDSKASRLDIFVREFQLPDLLNVRQNLCPSTSAPSTSAPSTSNSLPPPPSSLSLCSSSPVLCVFDDGAGMGHTDLVKMLSFGHKPPEEEDGRQIGRFGVGFKTGSMRLGDDALVLTQTADSRGVGLLSRTMNLGREELEIPILAFRPMGFFALREKQREQECQSSPYSAFPPSCSASSSSPSELSSSLGFRTMEIDADVDADVEDVRTKLIWIEKYTGFNVTRLESEFAKMSRSSSAASPSSSPRLPRGSPSSSLTPPLSFPSSGTHVFLFRLRETPKGSQMFELDWRERKGDIQVRTKRARARNNQLATDVPLDYSLREYLKLLFLKQELHIKVQGVSVVPVCNLFSQLSVQKEYCENVMGRRVKLTLGFSEAEKKGGRCGLFLYWHGRVV